MSINVRAYVEDIDTQIATFLNVALYRATSPTATPSVLVDSTPLVAAQTAYVLTDASPTANPVYRWRLENTTSHSEFSGAFRPELSLRSLRLLGAQRAGAAFSGVAVSGVTSPASLLDSALLDNGMDDSYLEGAWVYRPDAANAGDMVRRVKKSGFNITTGALAFSRDYAVAPAAAEEYQVFQFFPPIDAPGVPRSWDQIVRDALSGRWYIDQVTLGFGDGHTRRYSLATFGDITESTYRQVLLRTTDSNGVVLDYSAHTNGRFVTPSNNAGELSLDIYPPPSSRQEIIVECIRMDEALYVDTDTTLLAQRRAECAVVVAAFAALRALQPGKYEGEYRAAIDELAAEEDFGRPTDMILGL